MESFPFQGGSARTPGAIRVSGAGEAELTPDRLRLTVSAEAIHASATAAQAASARAMAEVVRTLGEAGIDARDVATLGYHLGPHHEIGQGPYFQPARSQGFEARDTIAVTIREPDKAGQIMDMAVRAGATSLDLDYDYDVPDEARALARERAVADAHAKALHLAKLAGVELGPPLAIEEREYPWARHDLTIAAPLPDTAPRVSISKLKLQLTVEIHYQIVVE